MKLVYLDNAATTPIDPLVQEAMIEAMNVFGNPSSTHVAGRKAKIIIEKTRSLIAKELNCATGEIFFTSGGTEADNMALSCAVRDLGVQRIIYPIIDHHAIGHTTTFLHNTAQIQIDCVEVDENGVIDLDHLKTLLGQEIPTLVSIMHVNNEIGNINPIAAIGDLCKEYGAYFHSDTVQSIGHYKLDLKAINVDFIACAAHKFHGPKGIGFIYIKAGLKVNPIIHGGGQERNMRAGTENIIGIAGLGKAFELAYKNLEEDSAHMIALKLYVIHKIQNEYSNIEFNGLSGEIDKSNYTVLNLAIPKNSKTEMILFNMDMKGIALSGGSACNSGSDKGSHVIDEIRKDKEPTMSVRLSFSKFTTKEDLDYFFKCLSEIV